MFVNQLGMTIFGLVISMAVSGLGSADGKSFQHPVAIAACLFAILFYLFLLYTMTWEIGYAEKVRIDGKRLHYIPLKGFYMSLVANIPNLILGTLAIIGYYGASEYQNLAPVAPEWSVNLFGICQALSKFLQSMYFYFFSYTNEFPFLMLLITLPAMITCLIAYILGVKGRQLFRFLGPTQSKE